jgi:hypothetical protein
MLILKKWTNHNKGEEALLEKINAFSLILPYFCAFFANCKNTTKSKETSKFRQETQNILSALKFTG